MQQPYKKYKRLYLLLTLLATCTHSFSVVAQNHYVPKPYKVIFDIERQSMNAGEMTISLHRNDKVWLASSSYKPSFTAKLFGLKKSIESTKFIYENGSTSIFEYNIKVGKKNNKVTFKPGEQIYNNIDIIPSNAQTNQTILDILNRDILQHKTQASYAIFDREKFKTYQINYQYNEKINIQGKDIQTVKTIIKRGAKVSIFWLAEKWNWAPVKFEKRKDDETIIKGNFQKIIF